MPPTLTPNSQPNSTPHLARLVLATFTVTFVAARVLVILIMAHLLPAKLFLHVGGSHIHHLNYGIFLLSAVGAMLLFQRPAGRTLDATAIAYGIGLALTFDEFGMWVHLGGGYWQRASYDAVVTVAAVLGLIAYAPAWKRANWQHKAIAALLLAMLIGFAAILTASVQRYGNHHHWESFQELEENGPQ